jgi:signal transduction histidine kinase
MPPERRTLQRMAKPSGRATPPSSGSSNQSALLSAICHDLRAPLAAVTMGANFVLQTTPDDEASARQRRILEAMLRSCAQMERLVRNFADLSEIEGQHVSLRLGVHDAGEMLGFAAEAANEATRASRVAIQIEEPTSALTVRCDRERVLRAIGHIVENAVKFSPQGGAIHLVVFAHDGWISFRVTDGGPGITPQVKRNLFDREWHAKRSKRAGAGFGLAIARGFALAHGGKIVVESQPGTETSVTFTIPQGGPDDASSPRLRGNANAKRHKR